MKTLRLLFYACLCATAVGCVSTAIDRYSSKYRGMFVPASPRDMFRTKLGTPVQSWETGSTNVGLYTTTNGYAWDAFAVRGKIAKPGDGAGQATVSAISLGTAEAIMIPFTILSVADNSVQQHTLVIFYDKTLHYVQHELYDKNGRREDTLGY